MTDGDHLNLISEDDGQSDITASCSESIVLRQSKTDHSACNGHCYNVVSRDSIISYCDSTENSEFYSAPPLKDMYRYHLFFSHSPEDQCWVEQTVQYLEAEPYRYKCHYTDYTVQSKLGVLQSLLCAAMLSERVAVVLSRSYIDDAWPTFQQIQKNLTAMSLHKQRMIIIALEDCIVPDSISPVGLLDAMDVDFYFSLVKTIKSARLPRSSESMSSDISSIISSRASTGNMVNGQLLSTVTISINGRWRANLEFNEDEDVPTPLRCHGINITYSEYMDILHNLCQLYDRRKQLSVVFTMKPMLIFLVSSLVWLVAFILVIVFLIDAPKASALPIRLTVFSLPLLLVISGYLFRWKRQNLRNKIAGKMLLNCVQMNQIFYLKDRPIILTAGLPKGNKFSIYFLYFSIRDCVFDVDLLLNSYIEDDAERFATLIELYTQDKYFLLQGTLSERITVMVGAPYGHHLISKRLPESSQARHTHHKLCLCQFVEIVIAEYFQSITNGKSNKALRDIFTRYLNTTISKRTLKTLPDYLFTDEECHV